jgi:hypothetical protein
MVKLGATGKFPQGKLDEHDDGGLNMAFVTDQRNGVVRVEFGKSLTWFALPAKEAREMAALLVEIANELDRLRS